MSKSLIVLVSKSHTHIQSIASYVVIVMISENTQVISKWYLGVILLFPFRNENYTSNSYYKKKLKIS